MMYFFPPTQILVPNKDKGKFVPGGVPRSVTSPAGEGALLVLHGVFEWTGH